MHWHQREPRTKNQEPRIENCEQTESEHGDDGKREWAKYRIRLPRRILFNPHVHDRPNDFDRFGCCCFCCCCCCFVVCCCFFFALLLPFYLPYLLFKEYLLPRLSFLPLSLCKNHQRMELLCVRAIGETNLYIRIRSHRLRSAQK